MKNLLLVCFLISATLACTRGTLPENLKDIGTFDVIVKNGLMVDGTGEPAFRADIIVQADTIAFIGKLPPDATALSVIDAAGKVVSPGFIDAHAHGNPLRTPEFFNFLAQGVTTICLGQDGFSSGTGYFAQWKGSVSRVVPAVNIAPFTGHGSLRMILSSPYAVDLSGTALALMNEELKSQLAAGSFGLTFGLEYVPGKYAGERELHTLAETVGQFSGILMAHIRNEDDDALKNSLEEYLSLGKWAPVHVSHLKSVYGSGTARATEILSTVDEFRDKGFTVTADVYPYTASFTGIGIVFPEWALPPADYDLVKAKRRSELRDFLNNKVKQRNGPGATLLGTAPYAGKTLADLEKEFNKPFADILIDEIGPQGASAAYFVMDDSLQTELLKNEFVVVSTDASPGMRHPRGYGSFGKIVQEYTVKNKAFTIEQAVRKMSGQTAEIVGLTNRGLLKVGYKADLLVFDPVEVRVKADFEHPHYLTEGFDYVLVNGRAARADGKFLEDRNGSVLIRE